MLTALAVAWLIVCPSANQQLRMVEHMTMVQVLDVLGYPDQTSSTMCGTKTEKPWRCRQWVYGGAPQSFMVLFAYAGTDASGGQDWRVDSWHSF